MRRPLFLLLSAAACAHDAPITPPSYRQPGPLVPGQVAQLTYNPGQDGEPAWLPDGSGVIYWRERVDRPDRDRCLAVMPAEGGTITAEFCDPVLAADDSTDAWQAPAPGPGGRLAFTRASSPIGALAPLHADIVVAPLGDPTQAQVLSTLPATAPDGVMYQGASHFAWLDSTSLVYLAEHVALGRLGGDTTRTGLELVRVDFAGTPAFTSLAGTSGATSVAAVARDTIAYTLAGDSRVYWRALSTDSTAVAYDFGAAGAAADVDVVGDSLVASVGGVVYVVRRSTGDAAAVTTPGTPFVHPVLSPDGARIVMEAITGRTSDLWELVLR